MTREEVVVAGLIDHGTSINWSWLTELGDIYLWVLKQKEQEGEHESVKTI